MLVCEAILFEHVLRLSQFMNCFETSIERYIMEEKFKKIIVM
jgi:hypothetical protein